MWCLYWSLGDFPLCDTITVYISLCCKIQTKYLWIKQYFRNGYRLCFYSSTVVEHLTASVRLTNAPLSLATMCVLYLTKLFNKVKSRTIHDAVKPWSFSWLAARDVTGSITKGRFPGLGYFPVNHGFYKIGILKSNLGTPRILSFS